MKVDELSVKLQQIVACSVRLTLLASIVEIPNNLLCILETFSICFSISAIKSKYIDGLLHKYYMTSSSVFEEKMNAT